METSRIHTTHDLEGTKWQTNYDNRVLKEHETRDKPNNAKKDKKTTKQA